MYEATPEQIADWKKKHGKVFKIEVDGNCCFLKKPDRKILSYASSVGANDPLKFNEVLLSNCWLGGDDEIKKDDDLFISVGPQLAKLVETKEASLVEC